MKYVLPLTDHEIVTLQHLAKFHSQPQVRTRGNAILLSHHKMQQQCIAAVFKVCRQTVSAWFDEWETKGVCGLFDKSGRGRKQILIEIKSQVLELVEKTPRSLTQVLAEIKKTYAIEMSKATLKRFCRRSGLVWKRVRKSLCGKRDDKQFYAKLDEIGKLITQAEQGKLNLCYFDESGFTLEPCVPYAWQPISETIKVSSSRSKRLNVLGFINHFSVFDSYVVEGSVTSDVVIACIDEFVKTITLDTILVIDNAPMHTSSAFLENVEKWERKGLTLLNIPAYSPELNKIEIVWRKIKYEWLDFSAYESFQSLKESLSHVLANIGKEYQVNFS
jgi:transposase